MVVAGGKAMSSCRAASRARSLENHSAYGSLNRGSGFSSSNARIDAMTNAVAPISLMSIISLSSLKHTVTENIPLAVVTVLVISA